MNDREAMNTEVRQYIRGAVTELVYDDTAANLTEELLRTFNSTPAIFLLIKYSDAIELVPNLKKQKVVVEAVAGLVVSSVGPSKVAALHGAKGSATLGAKITKAFHWYQPSWALERFKFRGEEDPISRGSLLLTQYKFATSVYETYS